MGCRVSSDVSCKWLSFLNVLGGSFFYPEKKRIQELMVKKVYIYVYNLKT